MELDIRPLTPDMADDYLHFFDHVAFTDHPDWASCYCLAFHFEPVWDAEDAGRDNPWRDRAARFIAEGKLRGYLAYADGAVAGWCNANDKRNYAALAHNVNAELLPPGDGTKVKSVVCFLVAPGLRGQGIATAMLERACTDARAEGYDLAEGYPPAEDWDMYAAHHGTVALFEKCGFAVHAQSGKGCIMRKNLAGGRP